MHDCDTVHCLAATFAELLLLLVYRAMHGFMVLSTFEADIMPVSARTASGTFPIVPSITQLGALLRAFAASPLLSNACTYGGYC